MSSFQGKVRNKSQARRESKNYLFFKELVGKQDLSILPVGEKFREDFNKSLEQMAEELIKK